MGVTDEVDLNRVFDGKDPEFMDRLFPGLDWRERLQLSESGGETGWSWFWDRFAPHGMLMSSDPACHGMKTAGDMSVALMECVALGFLENTEPAASFRWRGHVYRYWPLLRDGLPDRLAEYTPRVRDAEER